MLRRLLHLVLAPHLLLACGGDRAPEPPLDAGLDPATADGGDGAPPDAAAPDAEGRRGAGNPTLNYAAAPSPWLRVELLSSGTQTRIVQTELRSVPTPVRYLDGDMLVVAYGGGAVVGSALVSLSDVVLAADTDANGQRVHREMKRDWARATAWIKPSGPIDRVALLDRAGSPVDTIAVTQSVVSQRLQALSSRELMAEYPWINVDPGWQPWGPDDRPPSPWSDVVRCDEPTLQALRRALMRAERTLLVAVQTIVCERMGYEGPRITYARTSAGTVYINADWQRAGISPEGLSWALLHEFTHTYQFLVGAALSWMPVIINPNATNWPEQAWAEAKRAIHDHRLERGITETWERLHNSAVPRLARAYLGEGWTSLPQDPREAFSSGFASRYAASTAWEDMAELVELMHWQGGPAPALQAYLGSLPEQVGATSAVLYTKMLLLKQLGLVSEANFQRFAGRFRVTTLQGSGIHLPMIVRTFDFTMRVVAGTLDQDGGHFYAVRADGPTRQALLRVNDPDDAPLGMHRLGQGGSTLIITNGTPFEDSLYATDGFVFITSHTQTLHEGIILLMAMSNQLGRADLLPIGSFRIAGKGS